MIRKNASELETGMIIARPVHDMQGVLLLGEGTVVNAKNIQVLKAWGVSTVWIEGEAAEENETPSPARDLEEIRQEMAARFGETLQEPMMATIMELAAKLIAKRASD